ncbi:nuclear transport factor 2 family protein [Caulobacter sp. LARHSG274]
MYDFHEPTAAYQAPTPAQIAAAQDWVARFEVRWAKPDADALRDLMHPDTRNLIPPMAAPGDRETVVEHFRNVLAMLPDFRLRVVRWAPSGDTVMIEWEGAATVAGKPLTWRGVDRISLRGDRMYEGQVYWDTRSLAEQMQAAMTAA